MNNGDFNLEAEDIKLSCHVGEDGVIYLTAVGKINNDNLPTFTAWTEQVKQLIAEAAKTADGMVRVCSDVSGVEHFESKPIAPLRELFEYDKQYHMKSAIIGANFFMRNLMDAVIQFTGRTNIRQFEKRDDALEWLFAEESTDIPPHSEKDHEDTKK